MAYDVKPDGGVTNGRVFYDATAEKEDGLPDGMKMDTKGNLYCAGPGGLWVFSPGGKHLGTIKPPETPANCNWGDDGKSLYITARRIVPDQAGRAGDEGSLLSRPTLRR
jgi:gluconolactonase